MSRSTTRSASPDDPKAVGARSEAAQIAALKQRRSVGVAPRRPPTTHLATPAPDGNDRDQVQSADTQPTGHVADPGDKNGAHHEARTGPEPTLPGPFAPAGGPDRPTNRLRRPAQLWVRTSFRLPVQISDELRRMLLDERRQGRRLRLQSYINEAIEALPGDADALIDLIDTFGDELNIGILAGEEGYKYETSLSLNLTQQNSERLGDLVEVLLDRGLLVGRKTLVGVAVVSRLRTGSRMR